MRYPSEGWVCPKFMGTDIHCARCALLRSEHKRNSKSGVHVVSRRFAELSQSQWSDFTRNAVEAKMERYIRVYTDTDFEKTVNTDEQDENTLVLIGMGLLFSSGYDQGDTWCICLHDGDNVTVIAASND